MWGRGDEAYLLSGGALRRLDTGFLLEISARQLWKWTEVCGQLKVYGEFKFYYIYKPSLTNRKARFGCPRMPERLSEGSFRAVAGGNAAI